MDKTVVTNSAEETKRLGQDIATELTATSGKVLVLCLYGDLGSGKTTFVQGVAKGLGLRKRIISPTFVMVRSYTINAHSNLTSLYHLDAYRAVGEEDIKGLGFEEMMGDPYALIIIEWPEKLGTLLPASRLDVHFEYVDENQRKIHISSQQ